VVEVEPDDLKEAMGRRGFCREIKEGKKKVGRKVCSSCYTQRRVGERVGFWGEI
jgi:hypothetical protein